MTEIKNLAHRFNDRSDRAAERIRKWKIVPKKSRKAQRQKDENYIIKSNKHRGYSEKD